MINSSSDIIYYLCVEFSQEQYINLSEMVHVVKVVVIVTSEHFNLSLFVVSHFLSVPFPWIEVSLQ